MKASKKVPRQERLTKREKKINFKINNMKIIETD